MILSRIIKFLLRFFATSLLVYLLAAAAIAAFGMQENLHPADVLVVFGNKVEPSGEPSASLASRLDKALVLYKSGYAPWVIVSGGYGKEGWDEAAVMADYLVAGGIPRQVILVDSQGNNTALTTVHTAALSEEYGFHSYILVSHFYHLPRARLAFQRLGLEPVEIAHSDRFVARDFYFGLLREVVAFPVYLFRPI